MAFLGFSRARGNAQPANTAASRPRAGTLAAVVGMGVAAALGTQIPMEESGRVVETTLGPEGELVQQHIRGRQYLTAYIDMVGVPTICDGLTRINGRRVVPGQVMTEEECATALEAELITHAQGVMACTPGLALSDDPAIEAEREGPRFAAVSLAYNVGVGGFCGSTARRRLNAGDMVGGCQAMTWWNKAGGRVRGGLVARRAREQNVCLNGLEVLS